MSSDLSREEIKDILYAAQEKLIEAIELLDTYVRETDDRNAKTYLVDHLKIMASADHGFLSREISIDDLINRVDEGDEE